MIRNLSHISSDSFKIKNMFLYVCLSWLILKANCYLLISHSLQGELREKEDRLEREATSLQKMLLDKDEEVSSLQQELAVQKEANKHSPSSTMKQLVERLKKELTSKEKQHQVLTTNFVGSCCYRSLNLSYL